MRKITESELLLSNKRSEKLKKEHRKLRKKHLQQQNRKNRHQQKTTHYKSIIFKLFEHRQNKKPNQYGNKQIKRVELPEIFSVIHQPEDFLKSLYKFNFSDLGKLQKITVDHSKVIQLDLAAESILDFLIMELKKTKKGAFQLEGYLPDDSEASRYVRATGIIKNLDIKDQLLDSEQEKLHRVFKMRSKRLAQNVSLDSKGWKERAIEDFVEHINLCLKDHNKRLTRKAQGELAKYTGEILNNAEDHSGYDEVVITGYLDNSNSRHWCEIAIFNFGKTIADTFREMPDISYTHEEIDGYIKAHQGKNLFGQEWTKDNLLTLVALQGHISSKNLHKDHDRGQGTVDLIEFFQRIHRQCVEQDNSMAEMAILSGSTHIYFNGKYTMQENSTGGRKVIAFNRTNDLNQKPDSEYVKNLHKLSFPGTVISIRFPMKHENTESL
ncbi:MAG: hypothetical protein PHG00_10215 [Methylococcales bacterium]|nr:hypothetical protein [Methylococcales bacterium]